MDPLAEDFAAFADRRDPAALARVFDATAGRLLLVAVHLVGRDGLAEDLVQATFVQAMEHASRWDRSRPLWPWLLGILQLQAKMAWRTRRRRRELGVDEAVAATASGDDPFAHAASAEIVEAVARAIDTLPLETRQVLRLRLVHGLRPIEIARALELPAGTVRVRLHRGQRALQEILPAGLAGAVALVLGTDGALLAQVRMAVLAKAGGDVAMATAVVAGAGWMGTKQLAFAACATLLLLVTAVMFPWNRAPGIEAAPPAPDRATAAVPARESAATAGRVDAAAVRLLAEDRRGEELIVRVVDSAGEPVVGAAVELRVTPRSTLRVPPPAVLRLRRVLATATSDLTGTCRLPRSALLGCSVLQRRTSRFDVRATMRGHRDAVMDVPAADAGGPDDELRLELRPDVTVCGRVVDEHGQPVAEAELALGGHRGWTNWEEAGVRTGTDGRFELPTRVLFFDPTSLRVRHPAHGRGRCDLPPLHAVSPGTAVDVGTVVLAAAGRIRGRLVLADGTPLADHPLVADELTRHGTREQHVVSADADGRFSLAVAEEGSIVTIRIFDATLQEACSFTELRASDAEVRLVVDRQLVVVEARDAGGELVPGAPIVVQGFDLASERAGYAREEWPSRSGWELPRDAAGRRLLLSPFGWGWMIAASDEHVVPVCRRHEVAAGTSRVECRFVLQPETRFGAVLVTATSPEGAPIDRFAAHLRHRERNVWRDAEDVASRWSVEQLPVGAIDVSIQVPFAQHPLLGRLTSRHRRESVIRAGERRELRFAVPEHGLVAFRLQDLRDPTCKVREARISLEPGTAPFEVKHLHVGREPRDLVRLLEDAFAPGAHTFTIEVEGYCRAHSAVQVRAGEVAIVDVFLVPL